MTLDPPDTAIDAAILAATGPRSLKVAMVIVRVAEALAGSLDQASESLLDRIGGRVIALVGETRLIGYGDVSKWRHSEVTKPAERAST